MAGDGSEVAEPGGGGTGAGLQGGQCHGDGEVGAFTGDVGQGGGVHHLVADLDEGVGAALGAGAQVAGGGWCGEGVDGGYDGFACFPFEPSGDHEHALEGAVEVELAGVVLGLLGALCLVGVESVGPRLGGVRCGAGVGQNRHVEQVGFGLGHAAGVVLVGEFGPLGVTARVSTWAWVRQMSPSDKAAAVAGSRSDRPRAVCTSAEAARWSIRPASA